MYNLFVPRIETIDVPESVPLALVGKYVTYTAYKILESIGQAKYNNKAMSIQVINERLFVLKLEFNGTLPQEDIELLRPYTEELSVMDKLPEKVAVRNKNTASKTV